VRLIDFLILLLQTHASTLQRLAALLGEEDLLRLLEDVGDHAEPLPEHSNIELEWFESGHFSVEAVRFRPIYGELEGAVHELKLPAFLEFYLWSYPYYRRLIESSIDLKSRIRGPSHPAATFLVEDALAYAKRWVKQLPVAPELAIQVEKTALMPWVRFRSEFLKKVGKRPMMPL
jgi:hypothetical protein